MATLTKGEDVFVFNDIFKEHIPSNLPSRCYFAVEGTVTQVLTNSHMNFQRKEMVAENFPITFD